MASTAPPTLAYHTPTLSREGTTNLLSLLRILLFATIFGAAFSSRLFAVVRFESIIHEFDPWFNYRATRLLAEKGVDAFWNWFDPTAWYPLGRVVGGTLYPGLMLTSYAIYASLHAINIPVNIRDVCVLLAPAFSGLTAYAAYLFTKEIAGRTDGSKGKGGNGGAEGAGLWAALFIGIAPGYISRSVAGSYDNEAIAIFILCFTFYLWLHSLRHGSALFGSLTALFYFYMVAAWGGYAFITNMLPLHAFVLLLMGRYSPRLYVAYSTFYAVGTLASFQVPFVGFAPIRTAEHMAALGVFGLLQLVAFAEAVRGLVPGRQFRLLLRTAVGAMAILGTAAVVALTYKGYVSPWTGRFYSLWDTGYAKIHIPIIASVSEHQPTAWPSYFFDLHMLIYLFPLGVFYCFRELRDEQVFVIVYAVMASYFSGVMVRLMLTLTPCVCVAGGVAWAEVWERYLDPVGEKGWDSGDGEGTKDEVEVEEVKEAVAGGTPGKKKGKKAATSAGESAADVASRFLNRRSNSNHSFSILSLDTRLSVISLIGFLSTLFVLHCTYTTSTAYSSPSVVLSTRNADGSQNIIDDFREAYYWLRMNTDKDTKVMSWWDYGYQIAGFSERATLVDNNTWNNTHIATVGKAMSSSEEVSYPILRKHDVDYVLVIFGGLLGFSGDDINKFLWMIRIGEGVYGQPKESDFFTPRGEYKIDEEATPTMRNSLMYKMSYYRFAELFGSQGAVDRVRQQKLPSVGPTLDTLEEAYTSENWIVRIYAVKKEDILGRDHKSATAFNGGKRRKKAKEGAGLKLKAPRVGLAGAKGRASV